jgi:CRISPR/Cas system-associated exonuclease Cas4 (RecB family)
MIDRVQIDVDNVMHVVDYKSSKSKKYLAKDFFQLLTYAFVCLDKNPDLKVIRASYMMLKFDNEYITTEFKVPDILKIKNKYLDYAHKIRTTTEYEPNPSALCNYCDHLDLCPQGQERSGKSNTFNNNVFGEVSW